MRVLQLVIYMNSSCTGSVMPTLVLEIRSPSPKKQISMVHVCLSILILTLLPLFYGFMYLYKSGIKQGTQELKRISQNGRKKKPSYLVFFLGLGKQYCESKSGCSVSVKQA